ncbi:MAG: Coenzyme F420 hydrogenase/dehydrogenase, beta subunit C-terminal domain [Candidatus Omnitrophota bacterium]
MACDKTPYPEKPGENDQPVSRDALAGRLIGRVKRVYTGYAADQRVRYECSSGGIATALLLSMLEQGVIEGAVLACPVPGNYIRHRMRICVTPEEISDNKGTVYCRVDCKGILEFLSANRKIAVVGPPCLLRTVDTFIRDKKMAPEKIFKIGLFCGGVTDGRVLDYLCARKGVSPGDVTGIRYRSGGWPGRKMTVKVRKRGKGPEEEIVLFDRDRSFFQKALYDFCFSGPFFLKQCLYCKDQTAETADISLGDAWLERMIASDNTGTSMVIVRTARGEGAVKLALDNNDIVLSDSSADEVLASQGDCLVGRKLGLWGKHLPGNAADEELLEICRRYIPGYIPPERALLERRFFQWMASRFSASFAFACFLFYTLSCKILKKIMGPRNR